MDITDKSNPFTFEEAVDINLLKKRAIDIEKYLNTELINLTPTDYIIAGGIFPSLYHNQHVRDIDVFILNDQSVVEKISHRFLLSPNWTVDSLSGDIEYAVKQRNGDEYLRALGNDKLRGVITLTPSVTKGRVVSKSIYAGAGIQVQYILTRYKTREELIEHFDFAHCQMNYHDGKLYVSPRTFYAIKNKELINNHDKIQPWRIEKYKSKGYSYTDEQSTVSQNKKLFDEYIDEHFEKLLRRNYENLLSRKTA